MNILKEMILEKVKQYLKIDFTPEFSFSGEIPENGFCTIAITYGEGEMYNEPIIKARVVDIASSSEEHSENMKYWNKKYWVGNIKY